MKKDTLYLVTKNRDKNHSIQLWSDNKLLIDKLQHEFFQIRSCFSPSFYLTPNAEFYKKFVPLHIFQQGVSEEWIMLETWSDKEDLMLEFAEYCAKYLELPLDII